MEGEKRRTGKGEEDEKEGSDGELLSNSCYVSHSLIRDCVENFSSPIPNLGRDKISVHRVRR